MNSCKFTVYIDPKDIYKKIVPEQRNQFKSIMITKAELCENGNVEIECLTLDGEIDDVLHRQKLLSNECLVLN